ncbi:MAG: Hsp70 family protein [Myxococcota bacterium]
MACTVGVDFGTSTTEIAVYQEGQTRLVRDWDGAAVIPSVVAYLPNGTLEFGKAAKKRMGVDPQNTLHSVKRIIGLPWKAEEVQTFRSHGRFEMVEGAHGVPCFVTRAGKVNATEVAGALLQHMRSYPVFEAVSPEKIALTVPAAFSQRQRNQLVVSATKAGFADVTVIEEPYAAALPFVTQEGKERIVAVYDLGGGTFDFALLKLHGAVHWVLASGGEQFLGGSDIDLRLAEWMADETLKVYRRDMRTDSAIFHRLLLAAEDAKIALSSVLQIEVDLGAIDPSLAGRHLALTRHKLEQLCQDLVLRTFVSCDEVLAKAKVKPAEVNEVVLVGGSARMPAVLRALKEYFGREPLALDEPDQAVATGAAMAAAVLAGDRQVLRK